MELYILDYTLFSNLSVSTNLKIIVSTYLLFPTPKCALAEVPIITACILKFQADHEWENTNIHGSNKLYDHGRLTLSPNVRAKH